MAFGDFIRAVKADLKHDSSIVEDYDWNRLMSFKELDIKRFDELVDIIKNLRVNDRFLSLPRFPVKRDENTFDWNMEKTPFYNGARNGLGFSALIPIYRPNFIHKVVDGFNLATLFSMIQMSFNYDNQHFMTYEEDKVIVLSFIVEYITFFVKILTILIYCLLKEVKRNISNFLTSCMGYIGRMTKPRILNIPYSV